MVHDFFWPCNFPGSKPERGFDLERGGFASRRRCVWDGALLRRCKTDTSLPTGNDYAWHARPFNEATAPLLGELEAAR
eukprot:symbB.v1.2.036676.t1/scaffold5223.1/size29660/1